MGKQQVEKIRELESQLEFARAYIKTLVTKNEQLKHSGPCECSEVLK